MYGLEAISYANGWAMAAVGASIVITGLSMLSFLISQLHRVVSLFEEKVTLGGRNLVERELAENKEVKKSIPDKLPTDIEEVFRVYMSFSGQLGKSFQLTSLYRLSNEVGLPHPHLSIRNFIDSGILIPSGERQFSWRSTSV